MKNYAIIVAGGSGKRIGGKTPKQFLLLDGLPVLMHTINAFASSNSKPSILLVLNERVIAAWEVLCEKHTFKIPHKIIIGGEERFHSVKSALKQLDGEGLIAIHDGVRPLVSINLIDKCFAQAAELGSAIPAVMASDTIRQRKSTRKSIVLDRDEIFLVQTPQTFRLSLVKEGYNQNFSSTFTDDASVVEKFGTEVFLIEGERANIKITYQVDLDFAELLLKNNPTPTI